MARQSIKITFHNVSAGRAGNPPTNVPHGPTNIPSVAPRAGNAPRQYPATQTILARAKSKDE